MAATAQAAVGPAPAHGGFAGGAFAFILVIFILLVIIACTCGGGYAPTCGCATGYPAYGW